MDRHYIKPQILDSIEISADVVMQGVHDSTTTDNWAKQRTHFDDWDEDDDYYWGNSPWSDDDSPDSQGY